MFDHEKDHQHYPPYLTHHVGIVPGAERAERSNTTLAQMRVSMRAEMKASYQLTKLRPGDVWVDIPNR